jgi:hypothetical protein
MSFLALNAQAAIARAKTIKMIFLMAYSPLQALTLIWPVRFPRIHEFVVDFVTFRRMQIKNCEGL